MEPPYPPQCRRPLGCRNSVLSEVRIVQSRMQTVAMVESMDNDPAPTPPPSAPPPPLKASAVPARPRRVGIGVLVALIAASLFVGTGIGYVLGMPQRNDLEDKIEGLEEEIEGLEDEVLEAQSNLSIATDARDVCAQAATTADDLLTLTSEYIDTLYVWMDTPADSPEEADADAELVALEDQMAQQGEILTDELADCRAAARDDADSAVHFLHADFAAFLE